MKGRFGSNLLRLLFLMFVALLLVAPLFPKSGSSIVASAESTVASKEAVVIALNVPIDQGSASLVSRGIARAEADHAGGVIISMNTPGGLLQDMITIVDAINSSTVPVYTYVGNDSAAASAGSYVAMATDKIFMGPGSQIGPSTPYILGGNSSSLEQNHTAEFAVSFLQSLAAQHGRNVTAATQMAAYDIAYSYADALKYHVADASSYSLGETLSLVNLSGASVVTISENPTEELISFLSDPTVDGIILLIGIVAIVLDFLHPTIILSIAGAILIALGLIGADVISSGTGTAIAVPLILFAAAAVLIVFELKTGHGFMLLSGVIVGIFATVLLAYQIPYSPSPFGDAQYAELGVFLIAGILVAIYARWVGSTIRRKPVTGSEALLGKVGVATTEISPRGEVSVDGIVWDARLGKESTVNSVEKGRKVRVVGRSGLTLEVEPEPIKQNLEL